MYITKRTLCGMITMFLTGTVIVVPFSSTRQEPTVQVATEQEMETTVNEQPTQEPTTSEIQTEVITELYVEPTTSEPGYVIEWSGIRLTEDEFHLILTLVFCESGGESYEEQLMVALVVLNQISSGEFGNTVHEVIYKKNNFSVTKWRDFESRGWTESVEMAVLQALTENTHPRDMYYFRTEHYHRWATNYMKVGSFYFSTK